MRILVDENIPLLTVQALRNAAHDVLDIRGTSEEGASDDLFWDRAQQDRRLLISTDRGFADRRYEPHHGILIIRLRQPNRQKIRLQDLYATTAMNSGSGAGAALSLTETSSFCVTGTTENATKETEIGKTTGVIPGKT